MVVELKPKMHNEFTWELFLSIRFSHSFTPLFLLFFKLSTHSVFRRPPPKPPPAKPPFFLFYLTLVLFFPLALSTLLLPIYSYVIRLEKVSSQPPPWRGDGVFLAHVSHACSWVFEEVGPPLLQDVSSSLGWWEKKLLVQEGSTPCFIPRF